MESRADYYNRYRVERDSEDDSDTIPPSTVERHTLDYMNQIELAMNREATVMVDNDSVVDLGGDSEFERAADDVHDDELGIEDCTPMAENQINRSFSKKQLGRLDETSF